MADYISVAFCPGPAKDFYRPSKRLMGLVDGWRQIRESQIDRLPTITADKVVMSALEDVVMEGTFVRANRALSVDAGRNVRLGAAVRGYELRHRDGHFVPSGLAETICTQAVSGLSLPQAQRNLNTPV